MKRFLCLFFLFLSAGMFGNDAKGAGCPESETVINQAVFLSGFEEGNKAIWNDYDGNPDETNLLLEDPGPCNQAGNHIMRLRVPPGRGTTDLVKVLPGSYDKLYARWYQKWEPGYDFTARNHGGGLHAGSRSYLGRSNFRPNGSDWFSTWFEPSSGSGDLNARPTLYSYYRGMYMDCADPNGGCFGDLFPCMVDEGQRICIKPEHRETIPTPKVTSGRWYCVEIMAEGGTPTPTATGADGVQNLWIDGVEYGPFTNLWHRTTGDVKLTILWLSLFHHEAHSVEGIMLDNVVVSTQRIGCLAPPTPSAPSNLRIR